MSLPLRRTVTYTVVLERDHDVGGFVATCPALPGLVTEGDTTEATFENTRDAIRGYLASLKKDGLSNPEEREPAIHLIMQNSAMRGTLVPVLGGPCPVTAVSKL